MGKDTLHGCIDPKTKIANLATIQWRVCQKWPNMAKNVGHGFRVTRGFNRFIVPKDIGKDTLHGFIVPKTANLATTTCTKNG